MNDIDDIQPSYVALAQAAALASPEERRTSPILQSIHAARAVARESFAILSPVGAEYRAARLADEIAAAVVRSDALRARAVEEAGFLRVAPGAAKTALQEVVEQRDARSASIVAPYAHVDQVQREAGSDRDDPRVDKALDELDAVQSAPLVVPAPLQSEWKTFTELESKAAAAADSERPRIDREFAAWRAERGVYLQAEREQLRDPGAAVAVLKARENALRDLAPGSPALAAVKEERQAAELIADHQLVATAKQIGDAYADDKTSFGIRNDRSRPENFALRTPAPEPREYWELPTRVLEAALREASVRDATEGSIDHDKARDLERVLLARRDATLLAGTLEIPERPRLSSVEQERATSIVTTMERERERDEMER